MIRLRTPIALFTFNRPFLTGETLDRILSCRPSKIYLVQDGPRPDISSDVDLLRQVRLQFNRIPSEVEVREIFSDQNLGIKRRFYSALDEIFSIEEQLIIVEDDCLLQESFFPFAQKCLETYGKDERVAMVSAHRPTASLHRSRVFFDEFPRIWGWATWAHTWKSFREPQKRTDFQLQSHLDTAVRNIKPFTVRMMARDLYTPSNFEANWDIELATHILTNKLLTVTPPRNAVENLGTENGTHRQEWAFVELPKPRKIPSSLNLTSAIERGLMQVFLEDLVRMTRWSLALTLNPRRALLKLIKMVQSRHEKR